jgi:hypothetical protein
MGIQSQSEEDANSYEIHTSRHGVCTLVSSINNIFMCTSGQNMDRSVSVYRYMGKIFSPKEGGEK